VKPLIACAAPIFFVLAAAIAGQTPSPAANPRSQWTEPPESFTARVVVSGLASPWEVTYGPDGFLWVTERAGKRIVRINPADGAKSVAVTINDVYQSLAQEGVLGMALHPELLKGKGQDYVYVAYTYNVGTATAVDRRMRVRRYTYDAASKQLGQPLDLIEGLPHGSDHGGGRLVFGPDQKLYLSRGDHGANFLANYCLRNRAQDLPTKMEIAAKDWSAYQGKILRLNLDGSIPQDNPVLGGVRSHVYTLGHRNPQGMAFDGSRLYASEHGESVDDELNVIRAGRNYGWPLIAGYQDDSAYVYSNWSASAPDPCATLRFNVLAPPPSVPRQKESAAALKNFTPPVRSFFTVPNGYDFTKLGNATVAPAGVDIYQSGRIPGWRRSVLMTAMTAGVVYRLPIVDEGTGRVGEPLTYFKARRRYRDVAIHPDGARFYLATDNEGRVEDPAAPGTLSRELADPGAIIEYTFTGVRR
jgi:PQQ-dependent dehydrogenase (s-GDH family)